MKQQVLSEYYDAYIRDTVPLFITAGAASLLEAENLDWEKCQDLYNRIFINYVDGIIDKPAWYGKTMQLDGDSPQEQYLYDRVCGNTRFQIPWTQEKVDQLWEACERIYDEYGIAVDPRFLLAVIIQEGTGSFNTSSTNLAADGGHGVEEDYIQDLTSASNLLFEKTLGYIYYNKPFRETVNTNSSLLENNTGNIFTYYNWQTPIIDLEKGYVRTGLYAANYNWADGVEIIYEKLAYEGAGEDYNQYILSIDASVVESITQWSNMPEYEFCAEQNGVDYRGEPCGAYTIIAK